MVRAGLKTSKVAAIGQVEKIALPTEEIAPVQPQESAPTLPIAVKSRADMLVGTSVRIPLWQYEWLDDIKRQGGSPSDFVREAITAHISKHGGRNG